MIFGLSHYKSEVMSWKIGQHSVTVSLCLHDGREIPCLGVGTDAPSSPDPGGRCWDLTCGTEGRDPSIFISGDGNMDSPCRLLGPRGCSLRLCWFRAGGRQGWAGFGVRQWHPHARGSTFPPLVTKPCLH